MIPFKSGQLPLKKRSDNVGQPNNLTKALMQDNYMLLEFKESGLPETRSCPPYPALCVLPEPGGTARFPRPLLVKPGRMFNEIIQGLLGDGKPCRAEVIA